MTSIELYHIIVTIVCLFFGSIWTQRSWKNTFIKLMFVILTLWGILICLYDVGFISKL